MARQRDPSSFTTLSNTEKQALFLDFLESPRFAKHGTWGERFHGWLEEQAAEGFTLGQIAERMEPPFRPFACVTGAWDFLDEYVTWLIAHGYARAVRIEGVSSGGSIGDSPESSE